MSKEPELKARDKVVVRMTREGAVEENLTAGTEQRVSKRLEDAELVKPAETAVPSEALSAEEQKKVQMRRQQRQFQAEHAEDNDTQPPSETSVTEEKRAENPPQNVPEPLPSETPFKPSVLEQHGVSSHTGTVIAETVVTHKLRKTSAVEAVDADAILTQAAETASAKPLSDDAVSTTKRMQKLERKSEKAHERLDAAREKLPTHKVLKKERVFDEETGKGKTRLHFEDELKKPKGKGKPQFEADKTVRKVGDTLASGIHGKIHEVEQENTAVEAAHKTEIAAETAARHFSHHREKSINNALTRNKRNIGRKLFGIRSSLSDRPFLHKPEVLFNSVCSLDAAHNIRDRIISLGDAFHGSDKSGREHNFVADNISLLNGAEYISADHLVPDLNGGDEVPELFPIQCGNFNSSCKVVSRQLTDFLKRSLNTVKDSLNKSGTELNAEGLPG